MQQLVALSALCLAASLPAQNLITNGEFQDHIAPWNVTTQVSSRWSVPGNARVGLNTPDPALEVAFGTDEGRFVLKQDITVKTEGWYGFQFAARRVGGNGTVKLTVGTKTLTHVFTSSSANQKTIVGSPVELKPGTITCVFEITNVKDSMFVGRFDDVIVRPVNLPNVTAGEAGIAVWDATDNNVVIVFASFHRLEQILRIPGYQFGLELDPFRAGGLILMATVVTKANQDVMALNIPAALENQRVFFFQPVDVTSRRFGSRLGLIFMK